MSQNGADEENQVCLVAAESRGIALGMSPHPTEDRLTLGIDLDRSKWSADARERYANLEARLPSTRSLEDVDASRFSRSVTPALNVPASLWQHFKLLLSERWPRLFGGLRVKWRGRWP